MKKFIIITLVFIAVCLAVAGVFYWKSLPPKPVHGTIVGEVVATHNNYVVYIKPIGDNGTKQLLEFRLTNDTAFGSGITLNSSNEISELIPGAIVEINYTLQEQKGALARITADSIKISSPNTSSEWPLLILNKDYSWSVDKKHGGMKGEVAYVTKLTAPLEGYIIYVKHGNDARWGQYFLEKSNKFLNEELINLLEQRATGYTVEIDGITSYPFEKSPICGTFCIYSYELK